MGSVKTVKECPKCDGVMRTTDSREVNIPGVMKKRRKRCLSCGYRCTTHEVIASDADGPVEDYRSRAASFIVRVNELTREVFGNDDGGLYHGEAKGGE